MKKMVMILGLILLALGVLASPDPKEDLDKVASLWLEAVKVNDKDDKLLTMLSNQSFRAEEKLLSELHGILKRSDDTYQKCQALFVLQNFPNRVHAQRVLPYLKLENPKIYSLYRELPLISRFPAQAALIQAGPRVVPDILKTMAESDDQEIRRYCLEMIYNIYGPGSFDGSALEITRLVVNKYLAKLTDEERKKMLLQEFEVFCLDQTPASSSSSE